MQALRLSVRHSLLMSDLQPVVISGPSGTGKSTLLKKLFQEFPDSFGFSVSHTTRKKRDGETDGKEYHFTSEEKMKQDIEEEKFVEYTNFSGNYYGTSKRAIQDVLDRKRICILDIDEQGVRNIKDSGMEAIYVFIKPPSMKELKRRLTSRGTETEEAIARRMKTAESAMQFSETGVYDYILENNDLEETYKSLKDFLKKNCSTLRKRPKYNPAIELPLAASVGKYGQAMGDKVSESEKTHGTSSEATENSVAEIPLSPTKTTGDQEENPAVFNVGETPLLVINDLAEQQTQPDSSSVVVNLEEPESTSPTSVVCGRQSWCAVL